MVYGENEPRNRKNNDYGWKDNQNENRRPAPSAPMTPPEIPFFNMGEWNEIHDEIIEKLLGLVDTNLPGPAAYVIRKSSGFIEWLLIWTIKTFVLLPILAPYFAARRAYSKAKFVYNTVSYVYPTIEKVFVFGWEFLKAFLPGLTYARQDLNDATSPTAESQKRRIITRSYEAAKKHMTWSRLFKLIIVLAVVLTIFGIATIICLCIFLYTLAQLAENFMGAHTSLNETVKSH